jgi:hypothetical protein
MNRREREVIATLRAQVSSLQGRLSADLSTLGDGGDGTCRQALADAAERNNAAGSVLASATTPGELQVAQRIIIEGLHATQLVRKSQGLPLGPDLPDLARVNEPTTVRYGDEEHVAHPDYHPSRPHFFAGAAQAPAGFYATPWWKKALAIGGAVVGAEMVGGIVGDLFDGDGQDFGGGADQDLGGGDW